jgi:hypothetical protein
MEIPGLGVTAKSSNSTNHTYGMEADAPTDIGHKAFLIDAETEAAVLYDYATHPELREAVKKEFTRIHALFGEYQAALAKAYPKPQVSEGKAAR